MSDKRGYLTQVATNGASLAVTIPVQYTELFDIRSKDDALFTFDGENLVIKIQIQKERPPP